MITLDQVLLLEKKVENAVEKIEQLKAENDALRSKCAELTNALSAKTEQFSSFESDQSKIEEGILSALSRLSEVENAVLDISETQTEETENTETVPEQEAETPAESSDSEFVEHFDPPVQETESSSEPQINSEENTQVQAEEEFAGSFERVETTSAPEGEQPAPENGDSNKNLFDIF